MSKQKTKTDRPSKRPAEKPGGVKAESAVVVENKKPSHNQLAGETRVDAPHVVNTPSPASTGNPVVNITLNQDKKPVNTPTPTKKIPAKESLAKKSSVKESVKEDTNKEQTSQVKTTDKESRTEESAEQIRLQAAQLGERLRLRQKEIDSRESLVNAHAAKLENDARASRLWFSETRKDFDERELEIAEKSQQMQQCLSRLAQCEETVLRRQSKLDAQAERLEKEAKALEESRQQFEEDQKRRREEIEKHALKQQQRLEKHAAHQQQRIDARRQASLALVRQSLAGLERRRAVTETQVRRMLEKAAQPNKELLAREAAVREASEEFQRRRQQIFETERALEAEQQEVRQLRRKLQAEREEQQRLEQKRSQESSDLRDRMQLELDAKRRQLDERSEELDRAQNALRHLRAELSEMHRETLELRLATEELWMQLSGTIPPATLTRSLGRIRGSLAETYRAENAELARRKLELRSIGSELAQDHETLCRQKDELDAWLVRREREIEQQAQRLVAREQELLEQETHFEEKSREWATQRMRYQQEIRRLQDHLDQAAENGKTTTGLCGVF